MLQGTRPLTGHDRVDIETRPASLPASDRFLRHFFLQAQELDKELIEKGYR
jgi:hypothetical protein